MRILEDAWFWLRCMVVVSGISAQAVYAQPPSPARSTPSKVGGVAVADVLQRLGAKLERGSASKELDDYSNHFDRTDLNRDGKHTREEYVDKGGYMTPEARAGIFRAADGNADGVVTQAEYVLNRIITDEAKAIVQGMDDDEDGLVERAEFVKHATKLLSDHELAVQVFSALDANADGGIPIPEYLRVWGQWARAGQKSAEERIAARRAELAEFANKPGQKPAQPAAAGLDADKLAMILPAMERRIEEGKLVGGLGLVARGDQIVYAGTWGQRDREKQLPMTDDTIFRIYSMSKPVTSVAAMILVEEGKLGLDAPISQYLPEMAETMVLVETTGDDGETRYEEVPAERAITVRDLLRHTSGFTYGFFGNSEVDKRYRSAGVLITDRTLEDTVKKLSRIPLKHQPGSRWHYSVSTDVLGRVIEVASGQSLDQFLRKRIFEPLGMEDTFFTVPQKKLPRLAQMYAPNGNGGLEPANAMSSRRFVDSSNRFYSGGGGLCSTASDYLTFCRMLLNEGKFDGGRILRPETVRLMRTNQLDDGIQGSPGFQFGLGFSIDKDGVYSWGGAAGTRFWIDPKNKLITIYMVQINPTGPFAFGGEMKKLVYASMQ